jgi:hypothetical protein
LLLTFCRNAFKVHTLVQKSSCYLTTPKISSISSIFNLSLSLLSQSGTILEIQEGR